MEVALASLLCFPSGKGPSHKFDHLSPYRNFSKRFPRLITCTTQQKEVPELVVESQKQNLLRTIQDTQRGLVTNADQRYYIEEAMACLETHCSGEPIDLLMLNGTWRLQYTSARDVLVLFESAARLPFFQIGQIFQKFECRDDSNSGVVQNVVQWSIPTLLEEDNGATLLVCAKFSLISARNIYLQFDEISFQNLRINKELQGLIAPAIFPRSYLSLQILQFLRGFKTQIPVRSPRRQAVGGLYYLSYLDNSMLLGRAVGGGGVFIFTRAHSPSSDS